MSINGIESKLLAAIQSPNFFLYFHSIDLSLLRLLRPIVSITSSRRLAVKGDKRVRKRKRKGRDGPQFLTAGVENEELEGSWLLVYYIIYKYYVCNNIEARHYICRVSFSQRWLVKPLFLFYFSKQGRTRAGNIWMLNRLWYGRWWAGRQIHLLRSFPSSIHQPQHSVYSRQTLTLPLCVWLTSFFLSTGICFSSKTLGLAGSRYYEENSIPNWNWLNSTARTMLCVKTWERKRNLDRVKVF